MWCLRSFDPDGDGPYYLLVGVSYIVGRKNCAILLRDDQSISRSHAVLLIVHPATNLNQVTSTSVLTLRDTSKYGTFVNEVRLQKGSSRILKSGELVRFGVFHSKFRVENEPLIVSSSCLDGPVKIALNQSIHHLGGHVTSNWTEDNTYLVMSSVKVTVKTICALICGRPIVKPEFFVDLIEAIQNGGQLPNSESYSPPIDEPSIKPGELDITVKSERKSIFRGKTFFFLNGKQYKRLSAAITFGGGTAKILESGSSNILPIEAAGSCVIDVGVSDSQNMSNSMEKWMESIVKALERKGLRSIPEAEIGLAVIYNSTDIYCNPHRKPVPETCSRTMIPSSTLSQNVFMVDMTAPGFSQYVACVPDTQPSQEHSTRTIMNRSQVVQETPDVEEDSRVITQDISVVKESFSNSTDKKCLNEDKRQTSAIVNKITSTAAKSRGGKWKGNTCSQTQSVFIHDFFHPVERKRGRKETELSQVKFAGTVDPGLDHHLLIRPSVEKTDSKLTIQSAQTKYISENLKAESSADYSKGNTGSLNEDKRTGKIVPEKTELVSKLKTQKRKHDEKLDDDVTFSMYEHLGVNKRKKMESQVLMHNVKDELFSENGTKAPHLELNESENNENIPGRLLVTLFKSLVVRPGKGTQFTFYATGQDTQLKNFKKFRKVSYPGAKALPKIIGGTDLKAYQTKKSSEMEEWLRQEVEEQSQKAKEENLADDLFRDLTALPLA
ncbi:nibrin isoform X2 [Narcine bancroftii]|uniref:nibrin isoform X2 n=1 Tax=Narcine bancroftii TaxID=1343680 RepID=UPI0038314EDA